MALLLIPVATVIYSARYAIPASPLLAIGAVVGLRALARGRLLAPAASRAEAPSAAAT